MLVWLWNKHLSLLYWNIFPQYEDHSHPVAADAMKDNYYQHLQLPSRDEYPCHAKQWPTPPSEMGVLSTHVPHPVSSMIM